MSGRGGVWRPEYGEVEYGLVLCCPSQPLGAIFTVFVEKEVGDAWHRSRCLVSV